MDFEIDGDDEEDYDDDDDESMLMSDNLGKSESSFNEKMQYDSDNEMPQNISADGSAIIHYNIALCGDNESSEIIDENYDPSEFLLQGQYGFQQSKDVAEDNVSNDLVVSDSDDESSKQPPNQADQENEELWF